MDGDTPGLVFISVLFLVSGALALAGALFNWDWFFRAGNARLLTGRMSRRTARMVYFVAGCMILAMVVYIHWRVGTFR